MCAPRSGSAHMALVTDIVAAKPLHKGTLRAARKSTGANVFCALLLGSRTMKRVGIVGIDMMPVLRQDRLQQEF